MDRRRTPLWSEHAADTHRPPRYAPHVRSRNSTRAVRLLRCMMDSVDRRCVPALHGHHEVAAALDRAGAVLRLAQAQSNCRRCRRSTRVPDSARAGRQKASSSIEVPRKFFILGALRLRIVRKRGPFGRRPARGADSSPLGSRVAAMASNCAVTGPPCRPRRGRCIARHHGDLIDLPVHGETTLCASGRHHAHAGRGLGCHRYSRANVMRLASHILGNGTRAERDPSSARAETGSHDDHRGGRSGAQ